MKLYLVQHGMALSEQDDHSRPLSGEGIEQTKKVAALIKGKNIAVDVIWYSTKKRSLQTAQILHEIFSQAEFRQRENIEPLDPAAEPADEIFRNNKNMMIVGHLPFLQKLLSLLCAKSESFDLAAFVYSGVVCLEYKTNWRIVWMITPDMV